MVPRRVKHVTVLRFLTNTTYSVQTFYYIYKQGGMQLIKREMPIPADRFFNYQLINKLKKNLTK